MTLIAAKFFLSPLCVVLVSMAGRRWGLAVAGALGSLPVVAGPILLVIALENGRAFGAEAATGTVLALSALTGFLVIYGRAALKLGPLPSVLLGWAAFLLGIAILDLIPHVAVPALILSGLSFAIGLRLLPAPSDPNLMPTPPPWWDLPLRALTALALVVTISGIATFLGPKWSGLLAPFPILTAVLAVFTHIQGTHEQLIVLFRSFLLGFYSFAGFFFVLAITLNKIPIAPAFLLATTVSILVQLAVFSFAVKRRWG